MRIDFIQPGKTIQNAFVESFSGKFRDECLDQHWFVSLRHARAEIELWRTDYNNIRPQCLGQSGPGAVRSISNNQGLRYRPEGVVLVSGGKSFKRDFVYLADVRDADVRDAPTVMKQLPKWFEEYNEENPHKRLKMLTPRDFRRANSQ